MTELSYLWTTGTTGDGTSTYTQADTSNFSKVLAACAGFEGVAPGFLNTLTVTGAASPVAVNTGGGVVDGKPYLNSASVNVAIPTPTTLTRIDRVVLRADWAGHTVRITRLAGTEGGAAPAITQTPGTTYDIQLYQVSITTGGAITLTDERTFARQNVTSLTGDVTVNNSGVATIAAQAVTAAKILNATITATQIAAAAAITGSQLAAAAGIVDGQLVNGKVPNRQGGSTTDWSVVGSTNYTPSSAKIQAGAAQWSGNSFSGIVTVTFPVAFSNAPLCIATMHSASLTTTYISLAVASTTTTLTLTWSCTSAVNGTINFNWIAIGQP